MRFSVLFVATAAPFLAVAAPVKWTRAAADANIIVLQFAEILEQLETEFYTQALTKFVASDFTTAGISLPDIAIQNFQNIQSHEAAHVKIIDDTLAALGSQPLQGCSFNFDSVLTDVATMASVARVVEHVGVAAYMGGAELVTDKTILAAAAQILPIEARHQSFLNTIAGATNIPQAFDVALTPQDVLSIAGAFVSGCDVAGQLGIGAANAPLGLQNQGAVVAGTQLQFSSTALDSLSSSQLSGLSCQMLVGGQATSLSLPIEQCIVPNNLNGPVWIWITSNSQPLNANIHQRDASTIVAGPTAIFLDAAPDALGALVRTSANGSVFQSSNVISPAEAASLLSSAANPSSTASVIGGSSSNSNSNSNSNMNSNSSSNQLGSNFQSSNGATPPIIELGVTFIPFGSS